MLAAKSDKNWAEGRECLRAGSTNTAANRLYYALFQAIKSYAVMVGRMQVNEQVQGSVHAAARKIVEDRPMGRSYRGLLGRLVSFRITADYLPEDVVRGEIERVLLDTDSMRQEFIRLAREEK